MKRGGLFFGLMSALLVSATRPARAAAEERTSSTGRWGVLLGAQAGGSGYVQGLIHIVPLEPLHLEVGLMAFGPELFFNPSAGVVLEWPLAGGFAPYTALGGAFIMTAGPTAPQPCGKPIDQCPGGSSSDVRSFGYARLGLAKYIAGRHVVRLGVDAGVWVGSYSESPPDRSERFIWPMAGASLLVRL